ncbi:hypothetical protein [Allopusillimonas ginsengisoli]|uniref:hypothetical protein n=1 Tax=Allopusillimonas ginsengisoli TaxID=453575 RepID=UPI00101FC40E|nr:hypothetical protein [Allopusillimonas ginsengisoli]TEA71883.1 hypothetical protein ERE07_20295 [Allopusillimonas ginsengisoli]
MPNRRIDAPAAVRIDPELSNLTRKVNTGFVCGAHTYTVDLGSGISESILQTMEGAFKQVARVDSQSEVQPGAYFLDFYLSDFAPRLRFLPGFWSATADADTELAIRVRATNPQGKLVLQTTGRGQGNAEETGGCTEGEEPITEATRKALQRTMEDLVQKLVNTRILTDETK